MAPADEFFQGRGDRLFLGAMAARTPCFFDELVVDRQIGWHLYSLTHQHVQHGQHLSTKDQGTVSRPLVSD
jgi:hypothetical protein